MLNEKLISGQHDIFYISNISREKAMNIVQFHNHYSENLSYFLHHEVWTDVNLILQDETTQISLSAHKIILGSKCEFFKGMFSFHDKSDFVIHVPNAYVSKDIIMSFYEKDTWNSYHLPEWKYRLDLISCLDYFCFLVEDSTVIKTLREITIPVDEVKHCLDFVLDRNITNEIIHELNKILTDEMDLTCFPIELLKNVYQHRFDMQKNSNIAIQHPHKICIWDIHNGKKLLQIPCETGSRISFLNRNGIISVCDRQITLYEFDFKTANNHFDINITSPANPIERYIHVSPDDNTFIIETVNLNKSVTSFKQIYNVDTKNFQNFFTLSSGRDLMKFIENDNIIIIPYNGIMIGNLLLSDNYDGELTEYINGPYGSYNCTVEKIISISPDGKLFIQTRGHIRYYLSVCTYRQKVIYRILIEKLIHFLCPDPYLLPSPRHTFDKINWCWSPDCKSIIAVCSNNYLVVLALKNDVFIPVNEMRLHEIFHASFTPDSRNIVIGYKKDGNNMIIVTDILGKQINSFSIDNEEIISTAHRDKDFNESPDNITKKMQDILFATMCE